MDNNSTDAATLVLSSPELPSLDEIHVDFRGAWSFRPDLNNRRMVSHWNSIDKKFDAYERCRSAYDSYKPVFEKAMQLASINNYPLPEGAANAIHDHFGWYGAAANAFDRLADETMLFNETFQNDSGIHDRVASNLGEIIKNEAVLRNNHTALMRRSDWLVARNQDQPPGREPRNAYTQSVLGVHHGESSAGDSSSSHGPPILTPGLQPPLASRGRRFSTRNFGHS